MCRLPGPQSAGVHGLQRDGPGRTKNSPCVLSRLRRERISGGVGAAGRDLRATAVPDVQGPRVYLPDGDASLPTLRRHGAGGLPGVRRDGPLPRLLRTRAGTHVRAVPRDRQDHIALRGVQRQRPLRQVRGDRQMPGVRRQGGLPCLRWDVCRGRAVAGDQRRVDGAVRRVRGVRRIPRGARQSIRPGRGACQLQRPGIDVHRAAERSRVD